MTYLSTLIDNFEEHFSEAQNKYMLTVHSERYLFCVYIYIKWTHRAACSDRSSFDHSSVDYFGTIPVETNNLLFFFWWYITVYVVNLFTMKSLNVDNSSDPSKRIIDLPFYLQMQAPDKTYDSSGTILHYKRNSRSDVHFELSSR